MGAVEAKGRNVSRWANGWTDGLDSLSSEDHTESRSLGAVGVLCLSVSQLKSYTGWSSNRFMGAVSIILLDILSFLSLYLCEYGHMCTLAYIQRSKDHFECWTPPSILFETGFLYCLLLHM